MTARPPTLRRSPSSGAHSASHSARTPGNRCTLDGQIDQGFGLASVAAASVHQFGGSDAWSPQNSLTFPVRKGDNWRVNFFNSVGTCTNNVYWVPLGH